MNRSDKYSSFQESVAKRLEKLYSSPFREFYEPYLSFCNAFSSAASFHITPQVGSSITYAVPQMGISDTIGSATHYPLQEVCNTLLGNSSIALGSDIRTIADPLGYLQRFLPDDMPPYENWGTVSGTQFQSAFEPFIASINAIRVQPEVIEIPEKLIPEQFLSGIEVKSKPDASTRKLSYRLARGFITLFLIPLLYDLVKEFVVHTLFSSDQTDYIIQQNEERNQLLREHNQLKREEIELFKENSESSNSVIVLSPEDTEKLFRAIDYLLNVNEQIENSDIVLDGPDNSPAEIQSLASETEVPAQSVPSSVPTESPIYQSDDSTPFAPESTEH